MSNSPIILEEFVIVDDDGREVRRFTSEADPKFFVLLGDFNHVEWVMKTYRLTEAQFRSGRSVKESG